jgi:hypothetical protein
VLEKIYPPGEYIFSEMSDILSCIFQFKTLICTIQCPPSKATTLVRSYWTCMNLWNERI